MKLDTELSTLPEVGPKFGAKLRRLNLQTVKDLLWHFPSRYEDYSQIVPIGDLAIGQSATIQGNVHQISARRTWKKNLLIIEAIVTDSSGAIKAVWFNQPYITHILKEGGYYNFAGKVTKSQREIYLASPSYEPVSSFRKTETKHTAGLIPIYPETRGLTSKGFRYLIKPLLKKLEPLEEWLPEEILKDHRLPNLNTAIKRIHFPLLAADAENTRRRFAFEDLFLLQLNNLKTRLLLARTKAAPIKIDDRFLQQIINRLPFVLTESQKISLQEILNDIQKPQPMNRLLQGDVGSGKTVIAAIAALFTAKNNFQTAFMAPTEVLANQHYYTITSLFPDLEFGVALLTASKAELAYGKKLASKIYRSKLLKTIENGEVKIIIGTHAIIQKKVQFSNLALAIVDEQHRFGVRQRAALLQPDGKTTMTNNSSCPPSSFIPHFLSMSATPIPRTLSLTLFGDLDLSTITELPAGRKEIITKIVAQENRSKAYQFIREQIKKGRQIFVICPRIEPSKTQTHADETQTNAEISRSPILNKSKSTLLWETKAVKEEFERLSKKIFPDLRIVMLHGKMRGAEKTEIMKDFRDGKSDILVSTSVIEVGVDVPNAVIMMIEGAERFGLAQLYQFRGRVGRGEHQSFCFLFTESNSATAQKRLNYLLTAKNGFELAERDLQLRGPGQFLGESQTGIPDVAMESLKDIQLVKATRDAAKAILSNDPELTAHPALADKFQQFQKTTHLE